jgi:predicted DNA-binding ribbon-helix-helix protein
VDASYYDAEVKRREEAEGRAVTFADELAEVIRERHAIKAERDALAAAIRVLVCDVSSSRADVPRGDCECEDCVVARAYDERRKAIDSHA